MSDLISREDLIKAIKTEFDYASATGFSRKMANIKSIDLICMIFRLIDNAPTVPLPDFKDGYKQAIIDGKTNFSRPQGEWIDTGDMNEYWAEEYRCSICGAKDHWHNFCPYCGAKMQKGGAE